MLGAAAGQARCMKAAVLSVELVIESSRSLKDKRAVVRSLLDTARHRFAVSAAEVGRHEKWGRAELGFAVVASDVNHVTDVLDNVERFVWAQPEVEVTSSARHWLDCEP